MASNESMHLAVPPTEVEEKQPAMKLELSTSNVSVSVSDVLIVREKKVVQAGTVPSALEPDHISPARNHPSGINVLHIGEKKAGSNKGHMDEIPEKVSTEKSKNSTKTAPLFSAKEVSSSLPLSCSTHDLKASIANDQNDTVRSFTKSTAPSTTEDRKNIDKKEIQSSVGITLVPENRALLSDYNYILTQNIELFETCTSYKQSSKPNAVVSSMNDLPSSRVGLRCIHCSTQRVTAASFIPSAVSCISSGIGTIGARHFLGGKCPCLPKGVLEKLMTAKKVSQQQTRMQGKFGLDAYCRKLARANKLMNHEVGGIFIGSKPSNLTSVEKIVSKTKLEKIESSKKNHVPKELIVKDTISDRRDPSAFVEGTIEHFWECKHCASLPFHWRATGSVVFSAAAPSIDLVGKHLSVCQGKKPLRIPRNASLQVKRGCSDSTAPSVIIQWGKSDGKRKSGRIKRPSQFCPGSTRKKKRLSTASKEEVKHGVEEDKLALPNDQALTTEFAFFTVLQLKKCYLTKAGGSRGNCPVGYPGLACAHCAGYPNERRFFYTSADHLRNSFSHIPSHLAMCSRCPVDVKEKIEEFKITRNKQKSQLRVGDHKVFIDRVWGRLHGPGGGIIQCPEDSEDESDDNQSTTDVVTMEVECDPDDDYLTESLNGRYLESKEIAVETSTSFILSSSDKKLATNYVYYSLLQMVPKQYSIDSNGTLSDIKEDSDVNQNSSKKQEEEISRPSLNQESDVTVDTKHVLHSDAKANGETNTTIEKKKEEPETFQTLVCKHCMNRDMQAAFLPDSAEDLRVSFPEIPKHLMECEKCPQSVKTKLEILKAFRPVQEAMLKRGAHMKLMGSVWNRVSNHFACEKEIPQVDPGIYDISTASLLSESDRNLVSEFTYFTMQQMEPCVLENSGNGSRSMFAHGFAGLACKHCSGTPCGRKFFYRTSEILSGNYAHIPNHVLACKFCPIEVKQTLAAKKKVHQVQKQLLQRGSQRIFFNNIFDRLHKKSGKLHR